MLLDFKLFAENSLFLVRKEICLLELSIEHLSNLFKRLKGRVWLISKYCDCLIVSKLIFSEFKMPTSKKNLILIFVFLESF